MWVCSVVYLKVLFWCHLIIKYKTTLLIVYVHFILCFIDVISLRFKHLIIDLTPCLCPFYTRCYVTWIQTLNNKPDSFSMFIRFSTETTLWRHNVMTSRRSRRFWRNGRRDDDGLNNKADSLSMFILFSTETTLRRNNVTSLLATRAARRWWTRRRWSCCGGVCSGSCDGGFQCCPCWRCETWKYFIILLFYKFTF